MKITWLWATLFGSTGIVLGALGAHALKALLTAEQVASFETGVRYQLYHALFLLLIGLFQKTSSLQGLHVVRNLTVAGVLAFSVSIYLLNLQDIIGVNLSFLGPITPIGGLLLIAAWLLLLVKVAKLSGGE